MSGAWDRSYAEAGAAKSSNQAYQTALIVSIGVRSACQGAQCNHRLIGIVGMRNSLRGQFPDDLRSRELAQHAHAPVPDFPARTPIRAKTIYSQCKQVV